MSRPASVLRGRVFEPEFSEKMHGLLVDYPELDLYVRNPNVRYRVAHGGRNGSKSYGFADMALLRMLSEKTSITVCREFQTTIKDSVHQLLKDRIAHHKLNDIFPVITDHEIECVNGSTIRYKHLHNNVVEIKGLEGTDICWVFEGQSVLSESWLILDPTIRKDGSEIWVEFNPMLKSDFVYDFFVTHKQESAKVVEINYVDNPWCPDNQKKLAAECERNRPDEYKHVWMGAPAGIGQFFNTFSSTGNKETPFTLPLDCQATLIGSLDHGINHPTSFGLQYIDQSNVIHRIFTYLQNGKTTADHAEAVWDSLDGCKFSHGLFPNWITYDPSMETKRRLSDVFFRSDLDEYVDLFKGRQKSKHVMFTPSNTKSQGAKVNGCHAMRQVFSPNDAGTRQFYFFDGYNTSFIDGILNVMTDKNNAEVYEKADGDDIADEARYGIVACASIIGARKVALATADPQAERFVNDRAGQSSTWMGA